MERVITCPHCLDTNNCFEDVQPTFSSYLCFNCGYMSDSRYEIGNLQLIENMKKSPQLVRESQFEDKERNIIWFPSVINMGALGIIFLRVRSMIMFGDTLKLYPYLNQIDISMTTIIKDLMLKMHRPLKKMISWGLVKQWV